jgi:hypothetical protein
MIRSMQWQLIASVAIQCTSVVSRIQFCVQLHRSCVPHRQTARRSAASHAVYLGSASKLCASTLHDSLQAATKQVESSFTDNHTEVPVETLQSMLQHHLHHIV